MQEGIYPIINNKLPSKYREGILIAERLLGFRRGSLDGCIVSVLFEFPIKGAPFVVQKQKMLNNMIVVKVIFLIFVIFLLMQIYEI